MRVALCREAGGIGDVVRAASVARTLGAQGHEVTFFVLGGYRLFADRSPGIARVIPINGTLRRPRDANPDPSKHPYLARGGPYDKYVDLFCPGWRHESGAKGLPTKDRIECFHAAAGLTTVKRPLLKVTPEERAWGRGFLAASGVDASRQVVLLQAETMSAARNWDADKWRALVVRLKELGLSPVHIGTKKLKDLACPQVTGVGMLTVLRLIAAVDVAVLPDSGPYHVAAAVGAPTVGIFGCTNGFIISRHYPFALPLQALPAPENGCKPPCHYQKVRGFKPPCHRKGCPTTRSVPVESVVEATLFQLGTCGRRAGV